MPRDDRAAVIGVVGARIAAAAQYAGGSDLVGLGGITSVRSRNGHLPFGAVDGGSDTAVLPVEFELLPAQHIADKIVRPDIERRIIAPACGVTDLYVHRRQLASACRFVVASIQSSTATRSR